MTNRLANATSPYLLQHANNPVDWYEWGPEALGRARAEDRLILLSIGYAACHWCHVMEHESFENAAIATVMNEHYVNIKVDREERPDLDELYMAATQALNQGQGGWPMTVFLTPELEPVYAGTYFPPEDRWGRPGFPNVLQGVARAWQNRREELRGHARDLVADLARSWAPAPASADRAGDIADHVPRALAQLDRELDRRHGGFGGAPKFPPHSSLELLQRAAARGDVQALEAARITLDGIDRGGIHDHIGGGFARYAVDALWLVPHFEKMLADNALLTLAYCRQWQLSGRSRDREVVATTLGFLERSLLLPDGGFASSLDADSDGEEGAFATWTPAEVSEVLGDPADTALACAFWDIDEHGHLDGRAVPNLLRADLESFAEARGENPVELAARLDQLRVRLLAARDLRPQPGRDDKVVTSWNGLAIAAFAEAGRVFQRPEWTERATTTASFLLTHLRSQDGVLLRTWRRGRAGHVAAFLEDYAFLADALVTLAESTNDPTWLNEAGRLAEAILDPFRDPSSGALHTTAHHGEPLPARTRERADGATPAASAVAARALVRLAEHTSNPAWRDAAAAALAVDAGAVAGYPRAFATSLMAAERLAHGPVEVSFQGPRSAELEEAVASVFVPDLRLALSVDQEAEGPSTAIVCVGSTCSLPLATAADLRQRLLDANARTI